jgi:hypothetical protein
LKIESKMLATLMLASLLISATPMIWAVTMSINLSKSNGPVGTELIVTGKIVTYNGDYVIVMDINNDDTAPVAAGEFTPDPNDAILATGTASGYDVSETVEIPSAWGGSGLKIWLVDTTTAGGAQSALDFFTVMTTYTIEVEWANVYEGGGFGALIPDPEVAQRIIWTIEGGRDVWNNTDGTDAIIRVDDPDGDEQFTDTTSLYLGASDFGAFTGTYDIAGPDNAAMVMDGVWKAYLDIDTSENKANVSWTVRVTASAYERTMNIYANYYDNAGEGLNTIKLFAPNGDEITPNVAYPTGLTGGFTGIFMVDHPAKDAPLGTYSLKFYGDDDSLAKTVTYVLSKANIVITVDEYWTSSHWEGDNDVVDVPRMTSVNAWLQLQYPDGSPCNSIDLPSGFAYKTYLNGTAVYSAISDPITDFDPDDYWYISWMVPKDAAKGTGYSLNVTAASMADDYGNSGPEEDFSTEGIDGFTVTNGVLYINEGPTLTSPAAGGKVQRTLTAQARVDVRYADDSKFTGSDWAIFNATVQGEDDLNAVAADYNTAAGLWILKYVVPYDADLVTDNTFTVMEADIVDKFGNEGPAADSGTSGIFEIIAAKITVSELAASKAEYNTDDQVTVTFKAKYPSLASVTEAGEDYPLVTFYDLEDNVKAEKEATYNAATQTWQASFLVPADFLNGVYTASIEKEDVQDDATTPNIGPSTALETTYAVSRISLTDVYRIIATIQAQQALDSAKADAAKTAADAAAVSAAAAGTSANAALTAANAAGTSAAAAVTAANAAGTKADAAVTAANAATTAATAAKTSADAAKAAADASGVKTDSIVGKIDGLQTLVYGAIGAALIAAIAAIVALMQISRKIA